MGKKKDKKDKKNKKQLAASRNRRSRLPRSKAETEAQRV